MTTITFTRSGGLIGNEIHLELDLNNLPEDEAQRLQELLFEAHFFDIPGDLAGERTPDEFHYTIIVKAGSSAHTVHTSDTTMPKSLLPLVKELTLLKTMAH